MVESKFSKVLAIETSCDDTSVAVVNGEGRVLSVISAHQNQAHEAFGGIVPEIASRNHTHHLMPLVDEALKRAGLSLADVDGFAVTSKPGLIGSLLVGLVAVKSLSLATGKPFIGVNHLEGHLLAPFLKDDSYAPPSDFAYPYIALAISGGHTSLYRINGLGEYEVLGRTIDDAAGEAFDKFGKTVGLGFPGGVRVDKLGALGVRDRFTFPRSFMKEEHLNFSFSGMKASGARAVQGLNEADRALVASEALRVVEGGEPAPGLLADLCASFQEALVDVLLDRLDRAMKIHGLTRAVLTGGVSANSRLRTRGEEWAQANDYQLVVPPIRYCTDNAAMIGYAGIERLNRGEVSPQTLGPEPRAPLGSAPLPENLPEWLKKAKS
ncbi:MAG: tRNA (adenosine(37)-N6)-threonylcarbamoyltransferase complex transferase subunit TsaD [Proteobacteria bacterium]|nr:MAG: tRNA (adenosine(37)-N6)-threonylcarbamoyltransferase complex transferase subunit TsaD [Pseudomonadota bacterium]